MLHVVNIKWPNNISQRLQIKMLLIKWFSSSHRLLPLYYVKNLLLNTLFSTAFNFCPYIVLTSQVAYGYKINQIIVFYGLIFNI